MKSHLRITNLSGRIQLVAAQHMRQREPPAIGWTRLLGGFSFRVFLEECHNLMDVPHIPVHFA
jgi:hypothetical protein